jgi:hypothetical protein
MFREAAGVVTPASAKPRTPECGRALAPPPPWMLPVLPP